MKTSEIIGIVCTNLGISKAELAKRMGMLPSSLYRKLARESMTLEELQQCLAAFGVSMEFDMKYPDGSTQSSQASYGLLSERMELLEKELEVERKASAFLRKSLRDLRADLSNAIGYMELGERNKAKEEQYLGKVCTVFSDMELTIAYALGEETGQEPIAEGESEDIALLAGKQVLLVDDNELNRAILKELLVAYGLSVEEAADGAEAVTLVQKREPGYYHCILMDLEMPVMDGYEATMKIRKFPNRIRANIPIVALTANAVSEDRERASVAGMDGFLVKPVNSLRLLSVMTKYL